MKVEIWSDIMCPFCYIGKRRFEKALAEFPHRSEVEVEWKSFQLNPGLVTDPQKNINEYLSETKGWTIDYAQRVNGQVTLMAMDEGLDYDFDKTIVANSFDAHRLIQLARTRGKAEEMEERLFKAYFTQGKNIADHSTLLNLASEIGLEPGDVIKMLDSNDFSDAVENDIYESQQIGVRGVPYFVFNDKYAVSGAQAPETFMEALNMSWKEWNKASDTPVAIQKNNTCAPGGDCA